MDQGLPVSMAVPNSALDQRLKREGWSLHDRLGSAAAQGAEPLHRSGLDRWRQVVAPDNRGNFEKRLHWDGLTTASAAWALDPPDEDTPDHPPWWPLLEALRQAGRNAASGLIDPVLEQRGLHEPFVHLWRPAATWALATLRDRCSDLQPRLALLESAWLDLGEALLKRLCGVAEQALWELFYQRRTPGQMLLAHLGVNGDGSGEPVHEAYDVFVAELLSSGYGELLADFPVLGRLLAVVSQLWLDGSEEMLRRVAASREGLQRMVAIGPEAAVAGIQLGLSDPHRGGRAVAILTFVQASDVRKVVYKPKDMGVDAVYHRTLHTLNQASALPPLRCLAVFNGEGYGFMEWVEHQPAGSDEVLERFYFNAGRTMALLHLLGCTDCHYENLIACGDQLVLIDTETLLEADLRDLISDDGDDNDSVSPLQTSMRGSVLRSGLLPQWLMAGAGRKLAMDISALGIQPPALEQEQPGWLGLNSDGMMAGRVTRPSELPTSLPVPLGSPQRLTDFVDPLCAGFERQLQEVISIRPILAKALEAFRGQPRRLVARNTRLYFTIQRQMLEPEALRNAVAHGLKLEQLSRSFVLASGKPANWTMFTAEVRQMERLDIPFYEHLIDGEDLPLPEGLAPIKGFMASSGLEAAQRRLAALDGAEIGFQQQLVRGAIAARHITTTTATDRSVAALTPGEADQQTWPQPLDADIVAGKARQLAEQLWSASIRDRKGRPEWLGMDLAADGESFQFGLIGPSLYSGMSGIALALARLAQSQPPSQALRWMERAWSCLEALAALAERNQNDQLFRLVRDLPPGLSGSGGILLALTLLQQSGIAAAHKLSHQWVDQLRPKRLLADETLDIIGGVAGLIGPLLQSDHPQGLALALHCGERLLAKQDASGGWLITRNRPALTGFSHGAAGMAAALARLAQVSGDQRFAEAVQRAVAFERTMYVPEQGNWPDFRITSEPSQFMTSWCHGAPGILLSRLVLRHTGLADNDTASELEAARACTLAGLKRMVAAEADGAAHLCCGVFGLTALLRLDASLSSLTLPALVPQVERCLVEAAQRRGDYRFFAVEHGSLNIPGLFTGKAGVVLALQEVADGLRWMGPVLSAALLAD